MYTPMPSGLVPGPKEFKTLTVFEVLEYDPELKILLELPKSDSKALVTLDYQTSRSSWAAIYIYIDVYITIYMCVYIYIYI